MKKYQLGGLMNIIQKLTAPQKESLYERPTGPTPPAPGWQKLPFMEVDRPTDTKTYNGGTLPGVTVSAVNLSKPQPFPYGEVVVESGQPASGRNALEEAVFKSKANKQAAQRGRIYQYGGNVKRTNPNTIKSIPEIIVKGNRPYRFDRRVSDQGAGHKVASDILWNEYQNGKYAGDLSGIAGGRTIYYSPQGNDTVYMNPSPIGYFMNQPGLNWIDNGEGFMPVPTNRNNQERNKKAFYGNIRKSHVGATDTWMRPIFQKAKRGN